MSRVVKGSLLALLLLCLLLVLVNALYFIWARVIDVQVGSLDRKPPVMAEPPPRSLAT